MLELVIRVPFSGEGFIDAGLSFSGERTILVDQFFYTH